MTNKATTIIDNDPRILCPECKKPLEIIDDKCKLCGHDFGSAPVVDIYKEMKAARK